MKHIIRLINIFAITALFTLVFTACEGPMGPQGEPGKDAVSIVWRGELAAAPQNPQLNWAYYNTTEKTAYIWDGSAWQILAQDGATGAAGGPGETGSAGTDGVSIAWQGELTTAPGNPLLNWAYYDTTQKKSFIWNGTAWQVLAQDGEIGPDGPKGDQGQHGLNSYLVVFNGNGGTPIIDAFGVSHGNTAVQPADPVRENHTFLGWQTADGTLWNFETPLTVNITLYARWFFFNLADLIAYLDGLPVNNADNPYTLPLAIDLGTMIDEDSGWRNLLDAIEIEDKFVSLNLSTCTMSGTDFNADTSVSTGKARIVSIVLPDSAKSVIGFGSDVPANRHFTNLKSASGTGITSIGFATFRECRNLTTVDFPAAVTISQDAFYACSSLTSVSFPVAANIGTAAFWGCTSLNSASFPIAANISDVVFTGTGINPLIITLGAVPPTLGFNIFTYVDTPKNVTVRFPASGIPDYGAAPTDITSQNWGNAFRGRGWNGTNYLAGTVNENITLVYETY